MIRKTYVKTLLLILVILVFSSRNIYAQISECDDDQKFIDGSTWCPCPEDESLASICGVVKSADINSLVSDEDDNSSSVAVDPFITKNPLGGVTVSIYENVEGIPTGQPFGNLENKLVECVTSENEGKYFCPVRRLNPGNMAYVVFSCNGVVADVKIIPTVKSIVGLNSDVSCGGELKYTPLASKLEYANRDQFLGCKSEPTKPSESIKYKEEEYTYHSTEIGEVDGDVRFTPSEGFLGTNLFAHNGAYWEEDCVIKYTLSGNLSHEYLQLGASDYADAYEKCDYGGTSMNEWDKLTTPFRYDIPEERVMPTFRVWETRTSMQRELQDPRAYQQFNHLTFGDCLGKAYLRYYGQLEDGIPMSCEVLSKCTAIGDPRRNVHTTHSFGSRLASPITWASIIMGSLERDQTDVVCRDNTGDYGPEGADITVAEVKPPIGGENCEPGESGCIYKLDERFYLPQFFILAEGVTKPKTSETFGDSYGPQGVRRTAFEANDTEAEQPHQSGHYVNFECSSTGKNNCGMTSIRISSGDEALGNAGAEGEKGALSDRYRGYVDVHADSYDDSYETTYYDVGGDVQSLCTISSVQDLMLINDANETNVKVSNFFRGDKDSHVNSEVAGTATYATEEAKERDLAFVSSERNVSRTNARLRDAHDSLQRFASGEGKLLARWWEGFGIFFNAFFEWEADTTTVKSFGDRVDPNDWNEDVAATLTTAFCISEDDFSCGEGGGCTFPPYVEGASNGYPGSAGGCYPWNDVDPGDFCNVYPGPGENPEGKLRTCKVDCTRAKYKRSCRDVQCTTIYEDVPPFRPIGQDCECAGGETLTIDSSACSNSDITKCLRDQKDTSNARPEEPGPLSAPDFDPVLSEHYVIRCDLSAAGPMQDPGDIGGEDGFTHGAQVVQRPIDNKPHYEADSISASGNDTISRWLSPVATKANRVKAAFNDYATTNEADQGSVGGATHRETAGALVRGEGFGGTSTILDVVSNPLTTSSFNEDFAECNEATGDNYCWECNPLTVPDTAWCYKIDPPGEVDLNTIDGGDCKPNLTGSCPLVGEGVGELAQEILGAAGVRAGGTPGSIVLAAIVGETGWLYYPIGASSYKMSWSDNSISNYSEPWYARIPGCNEMVPVAQGPFGHIDKWFESAVRGDPPVREGGYHPDRATSPEHAVQVVSKCNFIDAAYASAYMLKHPGYDCSTDLDTNAARDMIKQKLAAYRGMSIDDDTLDGLVEIAVSCQ